MAPDGSGVNVPGFTIVLRSKPGVNVQLGSRVGSGKSGVSKPGVNVQLGYSGLHGLRLDDFTMCRV